MRPILLAIWFTLPAILSNKVFAQCETKADGINGQYQGCHVKFVVKDSSSLKPYSFSKYYGLHLLEENGCIKFCQIYQDTLKQLDSMDLPSNGTEGCEQKEAPNQMSSSIEGVINADHSGTTNTNSILGIYLGKTDHTEAFGAFSDLILNFNFIHKNLQRNIDLGGGKFNNTTALLRPFQVQNSVYDPYGRTEKHNQAVLSKRPYDSATSISILNVILDYMDRKAHIQLVQDSIECDGFAYFKIYEGNRSKTPEKFQMNQTTDFYLPEIAKVFGPQNTKIKKFHNLIIAQKKCAD